MSELHVLVDFENVHPTMDDLIKLAPKLKEVWLFHGPSQAKGAEKVKGDDLRVTLVPHSGKGKNALDFHLTFYLGYLAAKRIEPTLLVLANDRGYDSMLAHAKLLGVTATRMGFKAKAAPAAKKATPAKKVAAKKAAPAKPAAPVEASVVAAPVAKVPPAAKKAATKKAPAKKAPAKKVIVKKAPNTSAPAKASTAAKKAPAPKTAAKKVTALKMLEPKAASTPADKVLARAVKGLAKMGEKRPTKLKKLLGQLKSFVGHGGTVDDVVDLSRRLEDAKVIQVVGDLVLYP